MPNLYIYCGITIFFWSNEHKPIHVHGEIGGAEIKASIHMEEGKITRITYEEKKGKFKPNDLKNFKKFMKEFKYILVEKWCDYFVKGITPECVAITRRL